MDINEEDSGTEKILEILGDEYSREILKATNIEPMTEKEIYEKHDMSWSTVSRRINKLQKFGFLEEKTEFNLENKPQNVYESQLEKVVIDLIEGNFNIQIKVKEDVADKFTIMWEEIRGDK